MTFLVALVFLAGFAVLVAVVASALVDVRRDLRLIRADLRETALVANRSELILTRLEAAVSERQ